MAKEQHRAPESLSVWESNMKELRRLQPKLAVILEDYVARHGHEFAHTENATPAGRWIEGLSPKPFFQPDGEPKFEWNHKTKESSIFFLYGLGTPPYLFKAIRALPKDVLSLVVIEPNLALLAYTLHLTHVYQAMSPGGRLTFLVLPEVTSSLMEKPEEGAVLMQRMTGELREEALAVGITAFGVYTITLSVTSTHAGEEESFREGFSEIASALREWAVIRLSSLGNSAEDTMLGLRQMALMSPWIAYGQQIDAIGERFKGRPFVLVSAGPSLEKNFELLRDIGDKCVIVATDAVLGKMLKNGILPHVVCVLERGAITYDILFADNIDRYAEECSKILLVAQAVCVPKIFGRWPGPKTIIGKQELPLDQWFMSGILRANVALSGSSVAHMNYSIAVKMGASSIALIGQDLAMGEDGKTHAGNIFTEEREKFLKNHAEQTGGYRVPGALGGMVETTEVWLMFLRTLESYVRGYNVPTWDCTEGGALIVGTRVETFADYIAKQVSPLDPMEQMPADVIAASGLIRDKKAKHDSIKENFDSAVTGLDEAEKIIAEIVGIMEQVAAAGLEPARRIQHAARVGHLLDELHGKNPMFAFVTQSYVYLASVELAKTRTLGSVEMVERWTAFHCEILDAHKSVLGFIRGWLGYARKILEYYVENDLTMFPPDGEECQRRFHQLCEIPDGDESPKVRFELDALLAACDPVRLNWSAHILWTLAMFLLEEGRAEEANPMMAKAAADFDGKEMPVVDTIAFLKDYAKVLSTGDLCYTPPYHLAETILSNAIELNGGIDDEIRARMESILDGELAAYDTRAELHGATGVRVSNWFKARAAGERALLQGNLAHALRLVWKAIRDHGFALPGWAASHLDWLAHTMEKCFDATDIELSSTIDDILTELAGRSDILSKIPLKYTVGFIGALKKKGLNVDLQTVIEENSCEE